MALPATSPAPAPGLYARLRTMLPEVIKFLVVGGIGTVIDLGGAGLLHGSFHVEPLAAKAVSVTVATVFTYFGSRFWTFKERENQAVHREAILFFVLNVIGLLIAEAVIGLMTYALGLRGGLAYNAASFIGTGLGTIFRFYAYRKWVFLDPVAQAAAAPGPLPAGQAIPDYPPWELDPEFLAPAGTAPRAPAAAAALAAPVAVSYGSPWPGAPAAALSAAAALPDSRPTVPFAGGAQPAPAGPWSPGEPTEPFHGGALAAPSAGPSHPGSSSAPPTGPFAGGAQPAPAGPWSPAPAGPWSPGEPTEPFHGGALAAPSAAPPWSAALSAPGPGDLAPPAAAPGTPVAGPAARSASARPPASSRPAGPRPAGRHRKG